jgi:sulfur relay (sulfurtransferase) DsrC/TusE family protein
MSPTPQWQLRQVVERLERLASEIFDQNTVAIIQSHADGLGQLAETLAQAPTGLNNLTPQQRRVFDFIREHIAKYGEAPTRKEIAEAFSFSSPSAAQEHVRALERKGVITLTGETRGIRINELTADAGGMSHE